MKYCCMLTSKVRGLCGGVRSGEGKGKCLGRVPCFLTLRTPLSSGFLPRQVSTPQHCIGLWSWNEPLLVELWWWSLRERERVPYIRTFIITRLWTTLSDCQANTDINCALLLLKDGKNSKVVSIIMVLLWYDWLMRSEDVNFKFHSVLSWLLWNQTWSECEHIVYFTELTIPVEDAIEEAFERKKLKYVELVVVVKEWGWQALTRPVEISVIDLVAKSTATFLLDFGLRGRSLKGTLKEFSEAAEKSEPLVMAEALTDYLGTWINLYYVEKPVVPRCLGA